MKGQAMTWSRNVSGNWLYTFGNITVTEGELAATVKAMMAMPSPNGLYWHFVGALSDLVKLRAAQPKQKTAEEILQEQVDRMAEQMRARMDQHFRDAHAYGFSGFDPASGASFNARTAGRRADPPPPPRPKGPRHWKEALGFSVNQHVQRHEAKAAYKRKAMEIHQSHGGDHDMMVELNGAKQQFEQEFR